MGSSGNPQRWPRRYNDQIPEGDGSGSGGGGSSSDNISGAAVVADRTDSTVITPTAGKTADRRRHLFRRRKDHFASNSFDSSSQSQSQSRSSSVESQSSTVLRGLESALKTSIIFSWSSVESSCHFNNLPSFTQCESILTIFTLKCNRYICVRYRRRYFQKFQISRQEESAIIMKLLLEKSDAKGSLNRLKRALTERLCRSKPVILLLLINRSFFCVV